MTTQNNSQQAPAVTPPPVSHTTTLKDYENNPFMVALDGIKIFFDKAQGVAIAMLVLAGLSFVAGVISTIIDAFAEDEPSVSTQRVVPTTGNTASPESVSQAIQNTINQVSPEQWAAMSIALIFIFAIVAVSFVFSAYLKSVVDYTSARIARGHKVDLGEALKGGAQRFGGYLWLQVLIAVKTLLWSLLFIVPGIIMMYRYSLAGISYYDKKVSATNAIKDSLTLTKGAWLTTYASTVLFNLVTLGIAQFFVESSARVRLYQQLDHVTKKGELKPSAHILSWLTLILPVVAVVLFVLMMFFVIMIFAASEW